ncbi:SLBB domain-containing protein [Arundinibacter roseus]|uniref:Polysaccharide export protein n=1 Tax=Arundinibacter roseus TaxID=2070510 RepID=A0A4R4KDN1_9BACT|nr:SLBB domain-containing protein [Arundinibacter roseus]TDB64479.1 polysaccharide export protein [Arundinibacter roseus]
MNLNTIARYQKNFLFIPILLFFSISTVFSQVNAPAPAGTPSAPAPTNTGTTQGTTNQGTNAPANAPRSAANPTAPTVQGASGNDATDLINKSKTEEALKSAQQNADAAQNEAVSAAEQAKIALREKIFGYSIFANKSFDLIPDQMIATPRDYTIGPGDNLNLYIYGYAQIPDLELLVNRDGFVSIPKVGNVNLGGKSIEEAQKILLARFSRFIPSLLGSGGQPAPTKLMLSLGQIRSIKVFVTGEVINPGVYELTSLSSAFNALYQAGGPNEIGSFREVRVIRNNKVVSKFDIYDYLIEGTLDGDIRVQDNDNINVGYYKKRIEVTGNVKRPGIFEAKASEKLSDILRYAGGFTDNAYQGLVKVYRITNRERKILDVSSDKFDTFELSTGDEVIVETVLDRFENIVTIEGAVMRPGEYSVDNNPTLKTLLKNAQGLREDAFTGRVTVTRTREDQSVVSIPLNLTDLFNNTVPDLELTRLDLVTVPSKFDMAEQSTVHIQGEVNNTQIGDNGGNFPYMANMTLEDLLVKAGGFKESAASQVEVVRRVRDSNAQAADAAISKIYRFDVSRDLSLNGQASGFTLMPFDEVIVRKSPNYQEQQFVALEGEILNPGQYGIMSKNEKITDLLQRAGGLTDLAYIKGATLIRTTPVSEFESQQTATAIGQISNDVKNGAFNIGGGGEVRQEFIGIQLEKILKNPESNDNLIIQEGDIIRIPKRLETVQVKGELLYPTTVKYNDNMAFLDYVSQSGGFTRTSLRRSAYVKYPNGSVDRTRKFLFFNVYPKVEPGSEIYVPVKAGSELTAQQVLQQGVAVTSTLMTLILSVLAFRNIR